MTTVEDAHNIADMKYSMFPIELYVEKSKDRRDSTRS